MDLLEILQYIPPSALDYQEWVNVGMALKHEGYSASDWDTWSRNDSRYHSNVSVCGEVIGNIHDNPELVGGVST